MLAALASKLVLGPLLLWVFDCNNDINVNAHKSHASACLFSGRLLHDSTDSVIDLCRKLDGLVTWLLKVRFNPSRRIMGLNDGPID